MGSILYNIFIMPLEMVFQLVFSVFRFNPVYGIFLVSIVMNFLALPLYMRADAIQEEERDKVKGMSKWVAHIKKTFKGDERYMMLTRYYKQENYKPIYALRSTFSIALQIPFFMAAYNFLSNISSLQGQSFLIISDLSRPDALINLGGFSINVLPILMTAINLISGYVYLRGFPLKDKLQTYGIAIVFLVLLYNKPSGLVLYWTLNQVFSVLKNVFLKLFKQRKTKNIAFSTIGVLVAILYVFLIGLNVQKDYIIVIFILMASNIPFLISFLKNKQEGIKEIKKVPFSIFVLSQILLTILLGAVTPLSVISAEPSSFVIESNPPTTILLNNITILFGFFVIWLGIFYYFSNQKIRNAFSYVSVFLSSISIINFMCFSKNFGSISKNLKFDQIVQFASSEKIINLLVILGILVFCFILVKKFKKLTVYALVVSVVGLIALTSINGFKTYKDIKETSQIKYEEANDKVLNLSKNGKNVVIIFLDRAFGWYMPFMLNEKPEIAEMYDGFTYYSNTLSYGTCTNYATPALYGGYEYTPDEMNKRTNESLGDKHNEALRMLPTLFANNGFDSVITDPPYAGYKEISDLSVFKNDNFKAYHLSGDLDEESSKSFEENQLRNFIMYSVYQVAPTAFKERIYDNGDYLAYDVLQVERSFLESYNILNSLKNIFNIKDDSSDNFNFIQNDTPHKVTFLSTPDYSTKNVDKNKERLVDESLYKLPDGRSIEMKTDQQIGEYHVTMASILSVGKLINYLKENNVYDNSRIIVVADHAFNFDQNKAMIFEGKLNAEPFNPLLLVKDFNSRGTLKESVDFMTNADVPTLATLNIIPDPKNPFTGQIIDSSQKNGKQLVTNSHNWTLSNNNGNMFDTSDGEWWYVDKNIFDENNWQLAK